MIVVHANWTGGMLCLWGEVGDLAARATPRAALVGAESVGAESGGAGVESDSDPTQTQTEPLTEPRAGDEPPRELELHPFAASGDELVGLLSSLMDVPGFETGTIDLRVPALATTDESFPLPSSTMAHWLGRDGHDAGGGTPVIRAVRVGCVRVEPAAAPGVLESLLDAIERDAQVALVGASVEFWATAGALAQHLIAQQRVVPMLAQRASGELVASWRPWVGDEMVGNLVERLVNAMPPAARAAIDLFEHDSWSMLDDMLWRVIDARCRVALRAEAMVETVEHREASDPHVAWLQGLLDAERAVAAPGSLCQDLIRGARRWIGGLEERGASAVWRLVLRLNEPLDLSGIEDLAPPPERLTWSVSFHLQAVDAPEIVIDAADIWLLPSDEATVEGRRVEGPQELLLGELARASRLFKHVEAALSESEPVDVSLTTKQAYEFLREIRPVLIEQGFGVESPAWWDAPATRLGARLRLDGTEEEGAEEAGAGAAGAGGPQFGLSALVNYHWDIAVGDTTLTLHEFEKLAEQGAPLVQVGGRWVEIRPEDVASAISFIRENPGGQIQLGEAMRMAYASDTRKTGLTIVGLEATGWLSSLFGGGEDGQDGLPMVEQPELFRGTLRPYQLRGVSWMAFMERYGFGICLADDMGLGKTIQMLALMQHERQGVEPDSEAAVGPTLLIAPTSVLGNWMREAERFAPELRTVAHHGPERLVNEAFAEQALARDLIVTTYALAHRDRDTLIGVNWGRVVLDEAQFVKNPAAKQSQAVRELNAQRRVAMTGTPVENRLSELWSIMEFLNPGYLGTGSGFRKRFCVPIERYHDQGRAAKLKGLVKPFLLRRLKTDPNVVSDLPAKIENKEYCYLTSEQAELYESCVKRMLGAVEDAQGIHRRGLVLSALIRLKQICDHPALFLKDVDPATARSAQVARSGKCVRLIEQLEEVLAEGEQALVFTQFRQMGHLLSPMLRHEFGRDVLFLHGGTPQKQRDVLVDAFQKGDGTNPILLVSLRAGGVGLNLTAATHVFHFDRWWNPAVENQATDRAHRIGQTRTGMVHKYIVRGTLEERIDQMIEEKTELAEQIIGSGERWLTELGTEDLRKLLALRSDAVGDEAE